MPNDRRDALFEEALALPAPEREAFLSKACAGDGALGAELASLLDAYAASEGFFESLALDAAEPLQRSLGMTRRADGEPFQLGDMVAHYRIDAALGRGGMGVVYRATDVRLGRPVALKVLPAPLAGDTRARARLLEEARTASALDHPHICTILDVGSVEGGPAGDRMYLAMVLYEGETLADRLARGPVPVPESLRIGRQLAAALATAHAAGLVHRDVKPSNILLTRPDGAVRLVDFGIAGRVGKELPHTMAAWGSRRYMSPERASGASPDPRADVWSLGLVLRDLLDARPDPKASPDPEEVAALLHRCLDPDPSRRPKDAGEVLAALEPGLRMPPHRAPRMTRALGAAAAGLAAVLLGWSFLPLGSPTPYVGLGTEAGAFAPNRVLVLPLEDGSAVAELASFGITAADFVAEAIAKTLFAEAVPAMTALALARDGVVAPPGVDRLVHLARPVGASYVISGSYVLQGDSLLVRASLSSGREGRLVQTLPTVTASREDPGAALVALAQAAVVATALELDPLMRTDALLRPTPPRWEAYLGFTRAMEHFLARRFDEALVAFDEAHALDDSFHYPLFYRGILYLNMGRHSELATVIEDMHRAITPRSDPIERQAVHVLEVYLSGDLAAIYRAHRESERLGMIGPGSFGHFSMGTAALNIGLPREAVAIIRQSDPDRGELRGWPGYYDSLARAHLWLGEFDSALEAAGRLQAEHPTVDLGLRRTIDALIALGHMSAVDSVLDAGMRSMSDPGGLLRYAGNLLRLGGEERAARRQYVRAVDLERERMRRAGDSPPPQLRAALAESLLLAGELDEAEAIFHALAAESPSLLDPVTSLARLAALRGDTATVARIDEVLAERALEPWNFGAATYRRARIAGAQGDGDRAAYLLEQAWQEGFSIYSTVWSDPEFRSVRDHPALLALLAPRG